MEFNIKNIESALLYLSGSLKEDSQNVNEYISKNNIVYGSSIKLGEQGWVTPFCFDNYFADHNCDAEGLAKNDLRKFEQECLDRNLIDVVIDDIDKTKYLEHNIYYIAAKKYIEVKDNFIVAMCLMPLLETMVDSIVSSKNLKRKDKYGNKEIKIIGKKFFNNEIRDKISKNLFILSIFPSLISYMRLIYCMKKGEWKIKDKSLKRDLFFHGENEYITQDIDVIRLLNAIYVVIFIIKTLKL